MTITETRRTPRIGILWRGDPNTPLPPDAEQNRLRRVFEALDRKGLATEAIVYSDSSVAEVRDQLLALDGVLVWVDPIDAGRDRSQLDPMLRAVASHGVWVSAHPDVILKMGTKDVLVSTRSMGWGSDCYLHKSLSDLREHLPQRLAQGPRVLKQHRGNGGNGVWKLEQIRPAAPNQDAVIQVLHAQRGSSLEVMPLREVFSRFEAYFHGLGCMIEQPYQVRLGEGMIRCYLVRDRVAGFGHQFVTALLPPPPGSIQSPLPPPRLYYGPSKPEFQALKAKLESEWVSQMRSLLDIDTDSLPALWDADFLLGPKDTTGNDTYVLCEINVSSVLPFPDEAHDLLAEAVSARLNA